MHDAASNPAPLLSVVVPVWNRAHLIGECLASIGVSASNSASDNVEIVVVDDGSTDGTPQAVRAAFAALGIEDRARLIVQENRGPGTARNTAIRAARGTFVACLDSDDLWFPWTLPTLLGVLGADPGIGVMFQRARYIASRAEAAAVERGQDAPATDRITGFLPAFFAESTTFFFGTDSLVIRRELFEALGGFTDGLRVAEDLDFFLRLPLDTPITLLRSPAMLAHIETPGSLTKSTRAYRAGLDHLRAAERAGRYPGGAGRVRERNVFLSRVTQWAIQNAWLNGDRWTSYRLFLASAPDLALNRCARFILRYNRRVVADLWASATGRGNRGKG